MDKGKGIKLEIKMAKARLSETVPRWIANRLPKKVVHFAVIRVWAHATTGKYEQDTVPYITVSKALKRWEKTNE